MLDMGTMRQNGSHTTTERNTGMQSEPFSVRAVRGSLAKRGKWRVAVPSESAGSGGT